MTVGLYHSGICSISLRIDDRGFLTYDVRCQTCDKKERCSIKARKYQMAVAKMKEGDKNDPE